MIPRALLHTQLAIQHFTAAPSVLTLAQLRQSLEATLLILPVPIMVTEETRPVPKDRVKTVKYAGNDWHRVSTELRDLYDKMIRTCVTKNKQSFIVRFQTTPCVFSEVFIGKVMFPLFEYFKNVVGTFDKSYTHVVESVFLYFADHEGQTYNAEQAFRAVGEIPHATHDDYVYLMSVLDRYDPSRFRSSPHRGNIQIMFNPVKTRSVRDLSLDVAVKTFTDVRDSHFHTPCSSEQMPTIVSDVFASVFV